MYVLPVPAGPTAHQPTPAEKAAPSSSAPAAPSAGGSRRKSKLRADDGRLVRGRKSRARIREAARQLFRERGFDAATLRAIAERAGMGASSIYRHVQSKEELLIEELTELQEEAWRRFRAEDVRSDSTRDRVRRFLDAQHELWRPSIRRIQAQTQQGRGNTKESVKVTLDLVFFADNTTAASENYEAFRTAISNQPWLAAMPLKGTTPLDNDKGVEVSGLSISVDVSQFYAKQHEAALLGSK